MKKSTALTFPLLLALLSSGCSDGGSGSDSGQSPAPLPSDPPAAGEPPAPSPSEPGSSGPAGSIVVYVAHSGNQMGVNAVQADGQKRRVIAGDANYRGATADGWVILVQGQDLVSVRVADGTSRVLDNTPGFKEFRGVFDTNYVVYEHGGPDGQSLRLVRADGTARLTPAMRPRGPVSFIAVTPARRILYEVCDQFLDDGRCVNRALISAELDGNNERLVLPSARAIRHITDDDQLVYDRRTDTGTVVSMVRSDGSDDRALDEAESFFAGPLSNGRLVYNRRVGGQLDLYSVAADGTSLRALATSEEDEFYAGATSGRVLFVRGGLNERHLHSVDESTGDIRALQVAGDSLVRAVAPDDTVILSSRFVTAEQAQDNLYTVRADGSDLRAIADSSDMEWFEALAPDGRVVYRRCIAAPGGPCEHPTAQSDLYSVNQNSTGTVALAVSSDFEIAHAVTKRNQVVYKVVKPDQSDLYSVSTTGGRAEPLASTGDDERFQTVIESN